MRFVILIFTIELICANLFAAKLNDNIENKISETEKSKINAELALKSAINQKNDTGIAIAYQNLGFLYYQNSDYVLSLNSVCHVDEIVDNHAIVMIEPEIKKIVDINDLREIKVKTEDSKIYCLVYDAKRQLFFYPELINTKQNMFGVEYNKSEITHLESNILNVFIIANILNFIHLKKYFKLSRLLKYKEEKDIKNRIYSDKKSLHLNEK